MKMKEIQSINGIPLCDTEAREQLTNHTHEEYTTLEEVEQIFEGINIDINNFDMSDFATKDDVEEAITNVDLSNYATIDYVEEAITNVDLNDYALKSEIEEAKYVSYYDLYLKDENGDFVVDENGNYVTKDFITRTEVQEMIDEVVLDFAEKVNEVFPDDTIQN